MANPSGSPVQDLVGTFAGRLRYPWLVGLLGALLVADLVIPDLVPFVDEIILAVLTLLAAMWRKRKDEAPKVVDVTPQSPDEPTPPSPE